MEQQEIKSNELRIGNIVNYHGEAHPILPNDILAIYQSEISESKVFYEPINLSPKWLMDNGFKQEQKYFDGLYFAYSKDGIVLILQSNLRLRLIALGKGFDVLYVHHLQNIYFALTGNELIITSIR